MQITRVAVEIYTDFSLHSTSNAAVLLTDLALRLLKIQIHSKGRHFNSLLDILKYF